MFGLLRYFSVASALILCAAVAGLVALYRHTAENELIYLTETHNAILAHTLLNAVWPHFSDYLDKASSYDPEMLADRPEPKQMHAAIAQIVAGVPILKVKAYNISGTTIFSTDLSQIGKSRAHNPTFVATAAGGRPTGALTYKDRMVAFDGVREDLDVIESYIPVVGDDSGVEAVFELYTDVTPQMAAIRSTTKQLLAGLVTAFGLLYAALLLIVRRAERKLRAQYAELESEVRRRRQIEEELRAARDVALDASRAKSAFLANMSHELRTPLNAVIGFSELIAEQTFGPVRPCRYREYAADIRRAGRHLLALVDNVLDLAKIEAGKMEIMDERVDICAVIEDVCATLRPVVVRNGNRFILECAREVGWITTDEAKLRSILINILGNAAKFTKEGTVAVGVARRGHGLAIRVADSGIGIDPEKMNGLFHEFEQVDGPVTTRRFGGSGLGLAICRKFCEALGGEIKIASISGVGTSVTVFLPNRGTPITGLDIAV